MEPKVIQNVPCSEVRLGVASAKRAHSGGGEGGLIQKVPIQPAQPCLAAARLRQQLGIRVCCCARHARSLWRPRLRPLLSNAQVWRPRPALPRKGHGGDPARGGAGGQPGGVFASAAAALRAARADASGRACFVGRRDSSSCRAWPAGLAPAWVHVGLRVRRFSSDSAVRRHVCHRGHPGALSPLHAAEPGKHTGPAPCAAAAPFTVRTRLGCLAVRAG
jgi:hypothetical protein